MQNELETFLESVNAIGKEKVLEAYNNVIARSPFDSSFLSCLTLKKIFYSTLCKPSDLKHMNDEFFLDDTNTHTFFHNMTDLELKEKLYFLGNFGIILTGYYDNNLAGFIHKTLFTRILPFLLNFNFDINSKFSINDGQLTTTGDHMTNLVMSVVMKKFNKALSTQLVQNYYYIQIENVSAFQEVCQNVEHADIELDGEDVEYDDLYDALHSQNINEHMQYTVNLLHESNATCLTLLNEHF